MKEWVNIFWTVAFLAYLVSGCAVPGQEATDQERMRPAGRC